MMQPNTAKKYFAPLNHITNEFLAQIEENVQLGNQAEKDFLEDLYKWALECK